MTQNNYDLEIDQALKMANSHTKFVIKKEESLKHKKTKNLKIKNFKKVIIAIGTICICSVLLLMSVYVDNGIVFAPSPDDVNITIENTKNENDYVKDELDAAQKQQQSHINNYCNIYGLKEDVVTKIYEENKEHFKTISYLNNNNFDYYNNEIEILTFVRHLYQKPEDFNTNIEIIKDTNKINDEINEEQTVKYYSDLFHIDPVLVLAIEYQESSSNGERYASDVYINNNNPAGLISPATGNYWEFPSKEAGIIEHIYQLKKYYIDEGKTTPEQIKENYAPNGASNDPNNYNFFWVNNVNSLMEEIANNPNIFSGVDNNKKI